MDRIPPEARFCMFCTEDLGAPQPETAAPGELGPNGSVSVREDFVGRRSELDQLLSTLDAAVSGQGRLGW